MSSESARLPPEVAEAARDPARRFGSDGRYVLLDELGTGGAGRVFKAFDTLLARYVALKGLYRLDPDSLARFRREAALAARLRHPGIVAVHDFGDHDGQPYLVMDLVEGLPLHKATLDARAKVAALRDASRAVHCAHAQGILHRDLKPSNLMIDPSGRTLVMDFGLAREVKAADDPRSGLTLTGDVLGTPQYMSPEQAQGGARNLDGRTDVYGLGATLYHLLTGRFPHDGATAFEVLTSVVNRDPPPPGADPDLDKIVMKAMEKDRARRYATAEAFADDLDRWLRGEPVLATRPSVTYRLRKRLHRNPWAWGVGLGLGAAALVIAMAGGIALARERAAAARRDRARSLALKAGGAFGLEDLVKADEMAAQALALNPDDDLARYWRARVLLRDYESRRPLPSPRILNGYVVFTPPVTEPPELAAVRRSVEQVFGAFTEESAELHLARAVLALWDARYDGALADLARAEALVLPGWDLPYYRILALHLAERFSEARAAARLHAFAEHPIPAARTLGLRVDLAAALEDQLHGIAPDWETLVGRARALRERDEPAARLLEAQALIARARWKREHGQPLDADLSSALDAVEGLDGPGAHLARGDALADRAADAAQRGQVDPDQPAAFLEAADAYGRGIEPVGPDPVLLARRADLWREAAVWKHLEYGRPIDDELRHAREDYAKALEAGPAFVEARQGMAEVDFHIAIRRDRDREVEAHETWVATVSEAAEAASDHPPAWVRLGNVLVVFGEFLTNRGGDAAPRFEEAIAAFGRALEQKPDYAAALRDRALAHADLGFLAAHRGRDPRPHYEAAFEGFRTAIEIDASSAETHILFGLACQNFARALSLEGWHPDLDPEDLYRDAEGHYARATELNPTSAKAFHGLALVRMNRGSHRLRRRIDGAGPLFDKAALDADRSVELNPRFEEPRLLRGAIRLKRAEMIEAEGGDPSEAYQEAIRALDEAIQHNPGASASMYFWRGYGHAQIAPHVERQGGDAAGHLEEAVLDLEHATRMNPNDPEPFLWLGFAWIQRSTYLDDPRPALEESVAALTRCLDLHPGIGKARQFRGEAFRRLGRTAEARRDLEEAARLDPSLRSQVDELLRRLDEEF